MLNSLFFADYFSEKVLTRLVGRKDIDDALQRLNTLTSEENLMVVTRNLEVSHQVYGNVMAVKEMVHNVEGNVEAIKGVICNVKGYVKATKALTENVDGNVKAIQGIALNVDYNVNATKHGTQSSLFRRHACFDYPPQCVPQISHRRSSTFVPP